MSNYRNYIMTPAELKKLGIVLPPKREKKPEKKVYYSRLDDAKKDEVAALMRTGLPRAEVCEKAKVTTHQATDANNSRGVYIWMTHEDYKLYAKASKKAGIEPAKPRDR